MHEEDKEEIYERDEVIQLLKEKVKRFEDLEIENDKKNSHILSNLYESGIIDADGHLIRQRKEEEEESEMD